MNGIMDMHSLKGVATSFDSALDPRTVYLVSGRVVERKVGGRVGLSSSLSQRVVFAQDVLAARALLAELEPAFQPIGLATLFDYEDAARRLRAVAEGRSDEWKSVGA